MAIVEIKAYKASDNKIFENEKEAREYDSTMLIKDRIEKFVDDHGYNNMSKSDIEDMILLDKDELIEILTKKEGE